MTPENYPDFFKHEIAGPLYELTDIVLDVPSLLQTLSAPHKECIFQIDPATLRIEKNNSGGIAQLQLQDMKGEELFIQAQRYVLTCGEGTEDFLKNAGLPEVPMQRRPLHMVMLRHQHSKPIYVHCISDQLNATPALTITTHPIAGSDDCIWYLGGELAESGVSHDRDSQIKRAQKLLKETFPWCDFSKANWDTFRINRAEPRQDSGKRPDIAFMHEADNLLVCWPTKLTLAPALANTIVSRLESSGLQANDEAYVKPSLPFPDIASTPWSSL